MISSSRAKPLYGARCNGCGVCCYLGPCGAAVALLGVEDGPCPAMRSDQLGGVVCGLADQLGEGDNPDAVEACRVAVGAGIGCDMRVTVADQLVAPGARPRMQLAARLANRSASAGARAWLARRRLAPP